MRYSVSGHSLLFRSVHARQRDIITQKTAVQNDVISKQVYSPPHLQDIHKYRVSKHRSHERLRRKKSILCLHFTHLLHRTTKWKKRFSAVFWFCPVPDNTPFSLSYCLVHARNFRAFLTWGTYVYSTVRRDSVWLSGGRTLNDGVEKTTKRSRALPFESVNGFHLL